MRIFVGNLPFNATIEEIETIFGNFGTVTEVKIPVNRDSGDPRGFGFVDMPNDEEAAVAISELNGFNLRRRALNVNEAKPRENAPRYQSGQRRRQETR